MSLLKVFRKLLQKKNTTQKPVTFNSEPREADTIAHLLKEVTVSKKAKNYEQAIQKMNTVVDLAKNSNREHTKVNYPYWEMLEKLSKLYILNGQNDLSWSSLNQTLLAAAKTIDDKSMIEIAHSSIYGTMASQAKKEGKIQLAVLNEYLSKLCWCSAMYLQSRTSDLETNRSGSGKQLFLDSLKKSYKLDDTKIKMLDTLFTEVANQIPNKNGALLKDKISEILSKAS